MSNPFSSTGDIVVPSYKQAERHVRGDGFYIQAQPQREVIPQWIELF